MATQEKTWNVANRLHSLKDSDNPELNHSIAGADEIYDDAKGAKQSDINTQTDAALADRYTKAETYSKEQLDSLITTPDANYVTVATFAELPQTGEANTIYRVSSYDGTQVDASKYALYAWNGATYQLLAVRSAVGEVFDVSEYNSGATYETLADALAAVPASVQRGGMSIKFIQSSDNKYVQCRLMSGEWSTNTEDWAFSDDGIYVENPEFMEAHTDTEDKILYGVKNDGDFYFGAGIPSQIKDKTDEIESNVENKVDKIPGKGLSTNDYDNTAKEIVDTNELIEKPEYSQVTIDSEDKILEGITSEGKKQINIPIDTPSATIESIKDPDGRIEITTDSEDKIISYRDNEGVLHENVGLKLSSEGLANFGQDLKDAGIIGDGANIIKTLESYWEGSHSFNIVSVKKDGTGDFTNIQKAINSITDASVDNQYEIQVYDDWYVNDLKELWQVEHPTVINTSDAPSTFVAFIITKDYVHLRGVNGKREIYVESPNVDMPGSCFKNIHNIFVMGNCKIENFTFKIKGGRYAMHQDMSGYRFGPDSFKTTIYKHIDAIHYGNDMYTNGSSWVSTMAQANGIANGQTQIFIDVTWDAHQGDTSFYTHTNGDFTLPCRVFMVNCRVINRKGLKNKNIHYQVFGFPDRLSCQNNQYYLYNCDVPTVDNGYLMGPGALNDTASAAVTERYTKAYCLNHIIGHGNKPVLVRMRDLEVLTFTTIAVGSKIEVVGGTAKDDIFGLEIFNYNGEGITGTTIGGNYIASTQHSAYSKVYNLPYILGNCANNPKTLVLKITDANDVVTEHTITFDKNYMTSDGSAYQYNTTPAISQEEILDEVNEDFAGYFTMSDKAEYINSFDDCVEKIVNTGNSAIARGDAMVRDLSSGWRGWRMANEGESPDGFAAHKIAIGGTGRVLLADKNLIHCHITDIVVAPHGNMYKVGSNGKLVQTSTSSEASMISLDDLALCKINK